MGQNGLVELDVTEKTRIWSIPNHVPFLREGGGGGGGVKEVALRPSNMLNVSQGRI